MIGWQPWRRAPIGGDWVAPVALAVAFIIAFRGISAGRWAWPLTTPRETSEWLPWIAIIALIAGLLWAIPAQPRWVVTIAIFILSVIACALLLKFKFVSKQWTIGETSGAVV